MAREDLIPVTQRTKEEAKEISRKGGKASGESRREKAKMKSAVKLLLSLPVKDPKIREQAKALGFKDSEIDNSLLPMLGLYNKAVKGNVQAARLLAELNDENQVQGTTNLGENMKIEVVYSDEADNNED